MEFVIHWFWVIPIIMNILLVVSILKAVQTRKKIWMTSAIIMFILAVITPIKLDVNTKSVTDHANQKIQQTKVLPEKVSNTTFVESTANVKQIQKEDLQ